MQTLVSPKERFFSIAGEMSDLQLLEVANYMRFIQYKDSYGISVLSQASESTLDFWDNEEDNVWDNV